MTKKEATEKFVRGMNAISSEIIELLFNGGYIHEITPPTRYDRVHLKSLVGESNSYYGEIQNYLKDADLYLINTDDGVAIEVSSNEFEVEHDYDLPMWGTMWSFESSIDEWWLENEGGLQKMADCGFRIYDSDWGYYFGIDGAGYDFYESHWIPLYEARGLKWHEFNEASVAPSNVQSRSKKMKAKHILYDIDVDEVDLLETLPKEIEIPAEMTDEEEISDYISDVTGFCHKGFVLE